ncbi:MAG: glycosyltransferase, partial [Saprospiraceae bacterium]|nr:glycosyltransferase [Saprospiraceae bacterium]
IRNELPNVLFLLVGDGMQKSWLQEEARKRKLENIRFVGPVPKREVFKYILAADFGASVLKKVDTFKTIYSNKTFDYMACKKPIFMLIDGVSRQLVEDAGCGVYVEPENPENFKRVLSEWTAKDEETLEEVGESGYSYAKRYFDRKYLADQYLTHLQGISNKVNVPTSD